MVTIEKAAEMLGAASPDNMMPFDYTDPFNPENQVSGFLCRESNKRYGSLVIAAVNGEACTQVIWATPKLKYPFDKQGTFRFPPVKQIWIYDKLDGTNILAYRYKNAAGLEFTTYKLRLSPFIGNTRYGDFLDMWKEILAQHPIIERLPDLWDCSVGFELYGARNEHLIRYSHGLGCALLYGIASDGNPIPPARFSMVVSGERGLVDPSVAVPTATLLGTLESSEDPVASYRQLQKNIEADNKPLDDGKFQGTEGAVWYVEDDQGQVHILKCKPASIEAIHWANGGINKASIMTTCQNCLETSDELTWDTLFPLLREEYEEQKIEDQKDLILACINKVNQDMVFREKVLAIYREEGLNLDADKGGTMRAMSKHFARDQMKHVFTLLNTL